MNKVYIYLYVYIFIYIKIWSLEYIVFMVAVVTGCLLEILYVGLVLLQEINKTVPLWHFRGERAFQGSGIHLIWRPGDFLSSEPHRKPVFLVDSIIELCINVQEILEFVVLKDVAL